MSALEVARRVTSAAARGAAAVKARPRTSAALGALAAGTGLLLASLYTEESDCEMREAGNLDSRVDAPTSQAHFGELMRDWTTAAALYSKARGCHRAQYALGRLCYEGRGYVYDPEYGTRLYEQAALAGNTDAMYALACIALFLAKYPDVTETQSPTEGAKREYLYEAASLLRLARVHAGASRTLADFHDWPDPMKWIKESRHFIAEAAKADPAAKSQIIRIRERAGAKRGGERGLVVYAESAGELEPDAGTGGWRESVRRISSRLLTETVAEAEVQALLAEAESGDDAHKTAAARVGFAYVNRVGNTNPADLRAKSEALLSAAARNGDVGAIIERYHRLTGTSALSSALESALDEGVRAGSRRLLCERGLYYLQKGEGEKARKDFARAAEYGDWRAMALYRGTEPRFRISSHTVVVLPLPAALAATLHSAAVVCTGSAPPDLTDMSRAESPSSGEAIVGGKRSRWVRVAWPDLQKRRTEGALAALKGAYAEIFAAVTGEWVILEQIDPALFGTHNPHELTARAIRDALSEPGTKNATLTKPSVAFCVFDRPSVVASYDGAFATVSDHGQDRHASECVTTHTETEIDQFLRSRLPRA